MRKTITMEKKRLAEWIWNTNAKLAMVPIAVIAFLFILIFFAANYWSLNQNIDHLETTASEGLIAIAGKEANTIQEQLKAITINTDFYRYQTEEAMKLDVNFKEEDYKRLAYSADGVFYTFEDKLGSGAAIFYSGYVPIGDEEQQKVAKVLTTESTMMDLYRSNPLMVAIYYNTFDSLNIIYPYFDVISQYPPLMNIPDYNFYYEADLEHNPTQDVVWTGVYLDPAGNGWMASSIAPVYNGDFLEGVVGIDITVGTIVDTILNMDIPYEGYGILVDRDGFIMAMPDKGEEDFGLNELTDHDYLTAVMEDTFKPDDFNLMMRDDFSSVKDQIISENAGSLYLALNGSERFITWSTIEETGWKLLFIVKSDNIYAETNYIYNRIVFVGIIVISIMIIFFILYMLFVLRRTKHLSDAIAQPLVEINALVEDIGQGNYYQALKTFDVEELDDTAQRLITMGQLLGDANAELVHAKDEAIKANSAKSQFLSSMSHELRTPLNAVLGFAQLLELNPSEPLTEGQNMSVNEIIKAGNHLLALINEILDLARIEAGKMLISIEPVNISMVLDDLQTLMYPISRKANVHLNIEKPTDETLTVYADMTRIKQILINLISNAVKYNHENGHVKCYVTQKNDRIQFHVEDDGIGIDKEDIEKIFQPFNRSSKDKHIVDGTGIGLTVVKQLTELMQGSIHVESVYNIGSHFWVDLPLSLEVDDHTSFDEEVTAIIDSFHDIPKSKILYIEDNPANMNLVIELMKRIPNVELLTSTSGGFGYDLARAHEPDLIILDINLPDIDGYQVLELLKASEETKDIPVMALSANAVLSDIKDARLKGFVEYMTKPVEIPMLLTYCMRYLQ